MIAILATASAQASRYAPAAAAASLLDARAVFDPFLIVAILVGLIAGATWRAGDAKKKGEAWAEIRDDMIVSAMTGLANFVIAVISANQTGGGPLAALGLAMIIGAKGTDAMAWFTNLFAKK